MDKTLLTSKDVIEFLDDFKQNSVTILLEEAKQNEKNEIIEVAKKHGIDLKNNPDLAGFKNVYAVTGKANANRVRLIKRIIAKRLNTIAHKPIDIDHNRSYVTGHYLEARMAGEKGEVDKIYTYGVFYKSNFENEWKEAQELFKRKKLNTSFEIWCPEDKRIQNEDGTVSLADEELHIAGGAILFREQPAFKEARVLELAKKRCLMKPRALIFATEIRNDCNNCGDCNGNCKNVITSSIKVVEAKEVIVKDKEWICPHCSKVIEDKTIWISPDKKKVHIPCNGELIIPEESRDGKGKEKSKQKDGGTKYCVCPNCGYYKEHKRGEPCLEEKCPKCKTKLEGKNEKPKEPVKSEEQKPEVKTEHKVTCGHCGYMFDYTSVVEYKMGSVKCPKCQAVINQEGKVLQIPQLMDFKIACPKCNSSGWEILENSEEKAKVRCSNCNTHYELLFDKKEDKLAGDFFKLNRYINYIVEKLPNCKQCGHRTEITNTDFDKDEIEVKCKHCGLKYRVNYIKTGNKRIIEIKEIEIPKKEPEKLSTPEERDNKDLLKDIEEELKKKEEKATMDKAKLEVAELDLASFSKEELEGLKSLITSEGNDEGIEEAKRLTYEQRKKLSDDDYAVVVTVKNKKTGEPRKIRMFPINDEAHVRNALARLGQPAPQATLKKLGVSIESVRKKILKKARQLKMTQLLERYKKGADLSDVEKGDVKILEQIDTEEQVIAEKAKLVERAKAIGLKEDASKEDIEKAEAEKKAKDDFDKAIKENEELKKENTDLKKIIGSKDAEIKKINDDKKAEIEKIRLDTAKLTARKIKLGKEVAEKMSDEDILDDDKFEKTMLKIENASLKEELKNGDKNPTGHEKNNEDYSVDKCLEKASQYISELAYGE